MAFVAAMHGPDDGALSLNCDDAHGFPGAESVGVKLARPTPPWAIGFSAVATGDCLWLQPHSSTNRFFQGPQENFPDFPVPFEDG